MSTYDRNQEHLPVTPDLCGTMCMRDGCGQSMRFMFTLADVGAFCSEACRAAVKVFDTPAPFRFVEDGRTFICAWHKGFDRTHPANAGASHGICPACLVKL